MHDADMTVRREKATATETATEQAAGSGSEVRHERKPRHRLGSREVLSRHRKTCVWRCHPCGNHAAGNRIQLAVPHRTKCRAIVCRVRFLPDKEIKTTEIGGSNYDVDIVFSGRRNHWPCDIHRNSHLL